MTSFLFRNNALSTQKIATCMGLEKNAWVTYQKQKLYIENALAIFSAPYIML